MTHRRLFLYLVVSGMLVLGVAWWMSFRTWYTVSASAPPFTGSVHVGSGTVSLVWDPRETSTFPPRLRTIPVRRAPRNLAAVMGKWNVRKGNVCHLAFPVWLPFVVLAAGGWVLVRHAEKRPHGRDEKALATRHAAGGMPEAFAREENETTDEQDIRR